MGIRMTGNVTGAPWGHTGTLHNQEGTPFSGPVRVRHSEAQLCY